MKNNKIASFEASLPIRVIGAGGDGVGEYEGKPVYVPKTAPGDVVKARVENENADGFQARLISVETPSPERVPAPCPYFSVCGGCALQHVNENFYRAWKTEKILKTLERAGVEIQNVEEPVFLSAPTRRRVAMTALQNGTLGYNEYRSHRIVDAKICLILEPALESKMQALRPYLPRLLQDNKTADFMMQHIEGAFDLLITGLKTPLNLEQLETFAEMADALDLARISIVEKEFASIEILFTRKTPLKKFGAVTVALPPGAFLQASAAGENALIETVLQYAKGAKSVADLFCGAGTFAGNLLQTGANVTAIDGDAGAIQALAAAKHTNLRTAKRNLFKEPLNAKELENFDCVVLDPPRAGAKAQVERIADSNVDKVVYVSCNPASFARDARILQENGFDLNKLRIIDQFVWSAHVELAALFER